MMVCSCLSSTTIFFPLTVNVVSAISSFSLSVSALTASGNIIVAISIHCFLFLIS